MKHLIFTRFYCTPIYMTDEQLMSDVYLIPGFQHFNNFLIPSLNNQTSKNFTLVIVVHNELKEKRPDIFEALSNTSTSFERAIVPGAKLMPYVNGLKEDNFIFTRIDSDDCAFNQAVELAQKRFDPNLDFAFHAFMNGCTMFENKMYDLHKMESSTYDGWSSFSAFSSFMVNWKKHQVLPFYDHTKLKDFTERHEIELVRDVNHFYDYDVPCAWIYLQHETNSSIIKSGKNRHRSPIQLNYSKEKIKELFGI